MKRDRSVTSESTFEGGAAILMSPSRVQETGSGTVFDNGRPQTVPNEEDAVESSGLEKRDSSAHFPYRRLEFRHPKRSSRVNPVVAQSGIPRARRGKPPGTW